LDWSKLSAIADVLAALGVIASLLFVAFEVRKNTAEAKRTNWESTIGRLASFWSRTSNESLPEVVQKGREDFQSLTAPERVVFQGYHVEFFLALETAFVLGANQVHGEIVLDVCRKHLRYQLSFAGTRDWWKEFSVSQGLSPLMTEEIERAIPRTREN
jgi:hypothetical protein